MRKPKLMLDPGHGGHDPGAVNMANGTREKDIVLKVATAMLPLLEDKVDVYYTRKDDVFIPLTGRANVANTMKVDAFLSIHCNSAASTSATGFEVFTTDGITKSDKLATALFDAYLPLGRRPRVDESDGDPDKEASFTVLTKTNMPAVLFELEFIHTYEGSAFLNTKIPQMAEALSRGVLAYFKSEGFFDYEEPTTSPPAPVNPVDIPAIIARMAEDLAELQRQFPYNR